MKDRAISKIPERAWPAFPRSVPTRRHSRRAILPAVGSPFLGMSKSELYHVYHLNTNFMYYSVGSRRREGEGEGEGVINGDESL
eukprot:991307-Amorphochlora_amoeboformis.AAC.1